MAAVVPQCRETVLFTSERETAVAEATAAEAQARLTSKALATILLFHFVRCCVLSCRVFLSPFSGVKE